MPKLKEMDGALWKAMKVTAEIKNTKWFKSGHASVGKYFDKLNEERNFWKSTKTDDYGKSYIALKGYVKALANLEKALKTFLKTKEFGESDQAAELKKEISGWLFEIQSKLGKLVTLAKTDLSEMKENDAKRMIDKFNATLNA
jgi:hypothetical protein